MVVPGWSAEWNSDPRYMNYWVWCTSNTIHRHLMHAITCIVSLYTITTGSDGVRLLLAPLSTLSVNGVSSTLLISSAPLSSTALTSIMTGVVSRAWTQRYRIGCYHNLNYLRWYIIHAHVDHSLVSCYSMHCIALNTTLKTINRLISFSSFFCSILPLLSFLSTPSLSITLYGY